MDLAVGDPNEAGNPAPQIQQCVQLDRGLLLLAAERSPGEQGQAQVDGGGIERENRTGQVAREGLAGIQLPSPGEQLLGELGEDAPVMAPVGPGQRRASDRPTEAGMVQIRAGDALLVLCLFWPKTAIFSRIALTPKGVETRTI